MGALNSGYSNNYDIIVFGGKVTQVATTKTLAGGSTTLSGSYEPDGTLVGSYIDSGPVARTIVKRGFSAEVAFQQGTVHNSDLPNDDNSGLGPGEA